jgi:hypothetical protein
MMSWTFIFYGKTRNVTGTLVGIPVESDCLENLGEGGIIQMLRKWIVRMRTGSRSRPTVSFGIAP